MFKIERVIKGTNLIEVINKMPFRDKDQTWKTDIRNKEHNVTKIIHTKANELLIKSQDWGRQTRKGNYDQLNKSVFMLKMYTP